MLWACTNGTRSKFIKELRQEFEVVMDGDDGINVAFDVSEWKRVFFLMGARRR